MSTPAPLPLPGLPEVLAAKSRIRPFLAATPLRNYPALDRLLGGRVFVKHENQQPTGAFKVRGGINLISQLSADERQRGVIAASTGNHGLSIAYAARLFGVQAIICVPENANPVKLAAMRELGAEIVEHGRDFDEAREHCEQLAASEGYRYVHSGNEPLLISGVGTVSLEIFEDQPGIEILIVPLGGGSGAAAASTIAKSINPKAKVIAVQAEGAPAAYLSWKERRLATAETATIAEGLATRVGFELPQRILWEKLDDFILVSDDELRRAMLLLIEHTRNLIEAAGAAPLAGALRIKEQLAGKRVALVCSGGNVSLAQLRALLAWEGQAATAP